MLEFLDKNKEWIFSGVGITLATVLVLLAIKAVKSFMRRGPTVRVAAAMAQTGMGGVADFLSITVQNTTDKVFRFGNIFLELDTREQFMPRVDPLTGERQGVRRVLEPGDSFSFHIPVSDLVETNLPISRFRCAAVRDALGHVYRSSPAELRRVLCCFTDKPAGTEP